MAEVGAGMTSREGCARPAHGKTGNPQVSDCICARICARDAAGRAETGETQQARRDRPPPVRRGQRGNEKPPETVETGVVRLITQRSQVQILPPLPRWRPIIEQRIGLLHVVCARGRRGSRRFVAVFVRLVADLVSNEHPARIRSASVVATSRSDSRVGLYILLDGNVRVTDALWTTRDVPRSGVDGKPVTADGRPGDLVI
jgi:hypothetical protein